MSVLAGRWYAHLLAYVLVLSLGLPLGACSCFKNFTVCPPEPDKQSEAGSSYVSVLSVVPWNEIKDELVPHFDLTAKDALEKAIPATMDEYQKSIDSIKLGLQLSVPATSLDKTTAASTQTTPSTPTTSPTLKLDPFVQYSVANALFQEVKLLDKYVKYASSNNDYTPYAVRLQITLMPRTHEKPYDTYTTLSFFPKISSITCENSISSSIVHTQNEKLTPCDGNGSALSENEYKEKLLHQVNIWRDAMDCALHNGNLKESKEFLENYSAGKDLYTDFDTKFKANTRNYKINICDYINKRLTHTDILENCKPNMPIIVPLLVTENIESLQYDRSRENMVQLALSLLVMANAVGAKGDFEKVSKDLQRFVGRDFNSLLALGRLSDNTVQVRLGAMQRGTLDNEDHTYVMVPRTHNVTLLVLVPKNYNEKKLTLLARTTMFDAESGVMLTNDTTSKAKEHFESMAKKIFNLTPKSNECIDHIFADVQLNSYECFQKHLTEMCFQNYQNKQGSVHETMLWNELAWLWTGSPYSLTSFSLPEEQKPVVATLPDKKYAFPMMDADNTKIVRVYGGKDLNKMPEVPILNVSIKNNGAKQIPAIKYELTDNNSGLFAFFPLAKSNNITEIKLRLTTQKTGHADGSTEQVYDTYPVANIRLQTPDPLPFSSIGNSIIANNDGIGTLMAYTTGNKSGDTEYFIDIDGGYIDSISHNKKTVEHSQHGWQILNPTYGQSITVNLKNLVPGQQLNFVSIAKNAFGVVKNTVATITVIQSTKKSEQ
jgi:hypothetical protein